MKRSFDPKGEYSTRASAPNWTAVMVAGLVRSATSQVVPGRQGVQIA